MLPMAQSVFLLSCASCLSTSAYLSQSLSACLLICWMIPGWGYSTPDVYSPNWMTFWRLFLRSSWAAIVSVPRSSPVGCRWWPRCWLSRHSPMARRHKQSGAIFVMTCRKTTASRWEIRDRGVREWEMQRGAAEQQSSAVIYNACLRACFTLPLEGIFFLWSLHCLSWPLHGLLSRVALHCLVMHVPPCRWWQR